MVAGFDPDVPHMEKTTEARLVGWLSPMATQNNPEALFILGMLNYTGRISDADKGEGLKLIKQAAGMGLPEAIDFLQRFTSN